MRLLHTKYYRIEEFRATQIPLYAIISHRWGSQEIAYQDITRIQDGVGDGYEKMRRFCAVAASQGFEYAWADTCCIDKTSSSELSEAINSMYTSGTKMRACVSRISMTYPRVLLKP